VFARYGRPDTIHSDRGQQFTSSEFDEYLNSVGVNATHTTKYNPRGNGQCERFNGELQR
jgi:transposase InsO family protein